MVWLAASPASVRAYSNFADYLRPIEEGGGGGRLFTGTPADPYSCEVCHRGTEGASLEVLGLPEDGYVPGATYELTLRWPAAEEHVALMAELTDLAGAPAGEPALVPYEEWQPAEFCESEFPAADLCLAGEPGVGGCCRELDAMRSGCSFPGQRAVLWLLDCRSRSARFRWTAPTEAHGAAAGDVWFSVAMVTSDINNDALGDGVTRVRRRLHRAGSTLERRAAVGNCTVSRGVRSRVSAGILAGLVALITVRRRRTRNCGCL